MKGSSKIALVAAASMMKSCSAAEPAEPRHPSWTECEE